MKRNCSLDEISDGRLYEYDDLVQASCNGCKGNATCCHGMGKSIILDPFDIYRLTTGLNLSFETLLVDKIELNVVDGVILPNLKMTDAFDSCSFLNQEGRCSIHTSRPGICRIFPLGRFYDKYDFKYFLQVQECHNTAKTMVKVSKWIDTTDYMENKQFLIHWHYFLNDVEAIVKNAQDETLIKNLNMFVLSNFYIKPYEKTKNFYTQFHDRLSKAKEIVG